LKLLRAYFKRFLRHKPRLLAGVVAIPLSQMADVAVTILVGQSIEKVRLSGTHEWLTQTLMLMAGAAIAHAFFRFWQRWLVVVVSRRFEVELKQELFDHLVRLDLSFHAKSRSGDLVSRLTADVEALRMFLGPGLMYTLGAAVIVPISLGWLFSLNALLSMSMLLPLLAVGVIMQRLTPRLHVHSTAVQESLADISHRAHEDFGGVRVVQGYHRQDSQAKRFERSSEQNRDHQIALGRARGWTHASIHGSFDLTFAVILILGGLAAIDRSLPIGELFQFVDLTIKVFWPLIAVGWIAGMYPRAVASAKRVQTLLDTRSALTSVPEEETTTQAGAVPSKGSQQSPTQTLAPSLNFANVSYSYPDASSATLQDLSFDLPAGTSLGIVGPTGAGKTTLLLLMGRLIDPTLGAISSNEVDLRSVPLAQVRRALGYVPQDSFLFSVTYADNIRFGTDRDIDPERLTDLIEQVAMTNEVKNFPKGIETLVGERGVTLSGGQRQRTCIARALARKPQILILDDCLSAVDTDTEKTLLQSLRKEGQGRSVVLAAHRLSSVAGCDQILVLDEAGAQADMGTHEELVKRSGWYKQTWNHQQRRAALGDDT
jgi:ATP-binding cassette subfamily B protein